MENNPLGLVFNTSVVRYESIQCATIVEVLAELHLSIVVQQAWFYTRSDRGPS